MEGLFTDNQLDKLEEKIESILHMYTGLKDEKVALSDRIQSLESENQDLKERVDRAESEKDVIMQKVKGILNKIEQLEA
jgi:predicted  nucleic acid-binding Zn-ribbon protein